MPYYSAPEERTAAPEPSAREWHERWTKELQAAHKEVEDWHTEGKKIVEIFSVKEGAKGLNLFTVNVDTQLALLYGGIPKVSVERRYGDATDDAARVAGELLERCLNADLEKAGDTYATAIRNALKDRMKPGCGIARVRYVAKYEATPERPAMLRPDGGELAPAVPASKRKTYECVHTDYVHWRDFRWSPARVWSPDVRWVAFGNDMSLQQLAERFGKEVADGVPLTTPGPEEKDDALRRKDPLARARVWEIWDATSRKVFWWAEGAGACLDIEDDPLGLDRFFPCPEPMFSLVSTDKVLPTPDYRVAEHLYREVDNLTKRISDLTDNARVAGVYDNANPQVKRLFMDKKGEDALIAVENWAKLSEKGGLRGSIEFLPLQEVVAAISTLQQQRMQTKQDLYEVTGLSDILRGQGQGPGITLGEQQMKAEFASTRLRKVQKDLARFASEIQCLKAEVICRLFDPETILQQANAQHMGETPETLSAAVALLKSQYAYYRVEVKPESMSALAFAQLRAERTEVFETVLKYLQAMAPMLELMPAALPFMLRLLQSLIAGLPGAATMEGVIDSAIQAAEQQQAQPQQAQQDPKLQAAQAKAQGDIAKIKGETEARLVELQAEVAADERREANQMRFNVEEHRQKQLISNVLRPPQSTSNGSGEVPR